MATETAPAQEPSRTSTDSGARTSIDQNLTPAMQRFLGAMHWWWSVGVGQPTSEQVAAVMGILPRGGNWSTPRSELRKAGLIEYGDNGTQWLTDDGLGVTPGESDLVKTLAGLHERVLGRLKPREADMLRACIDVWPDSLTNDEMARAGGLPTTKGGNFSMPRARLRKFGLISGSGENRAADMLFPDGLD